MDIVLSVLVIVVAAALIYVALALSRCRKRSVQIEAELRRQKEKYDSDIRQSTDHIMALQAENQRLAKWQIVADADDKARELLQTAQATLDRAKADAAQERTDALQRATAVVKTAQDEADSLTRETRQKTKQQKEEAQAALDWATSKAAQIVEKANKKAAEVAGSAYEAMKNADQYERTVKAMKNIIEGYGDQYLVPGHSLLDDLADDFGHTQAGQELKRARDHTKVMIQNGTAATCSYVEASRHDTAVNFVIDAFNGRADSILSRVRHDNAGKLEQEIRDAFTLVNFNGKAFRDARITEEFLAARLDELKWAAVAQQLKLEEREEQRRIKEQMREEEKARREYERAMREAARDEEALRKAMEKAQQQVEQATEEQKAKYEEKLQDLAARLKEAEERNQRAISMAQHTKKGYVYVISNVGSFGENVYKIGLTRRLEPLDRIRELGDSSVPFEFDVHAMLLSDDAPALESQLHKHFVLMQMNKVNHRKEFFRVDLKHIHEEVGKLGLTAKWTIAAEAAEYRETLAIEKAIKDSDSAREAWTRRQLELEPVANLFAEDSPSGEEAERTPSRKAGMATQPLTPQSLTPDVEQLEA